MGLTLARRTSSYRNASMRGIRFFAFVSIQGAGIMLSNNFSQIVKAGFWGNMRSERLQLRLSGFENDASTRESNHNFHLIMKVPANICVSSFFVWGGGGGAGLRLFGLDPSTQGSTRDTGRLDCYPAKWSQAARLVESQLGELTKNDRLSC